MKMNTDTLNANYEHLPQQLRHPGGMVEQIMDYINMTSMSYQPLFALSAALATCGLLYGRRFEDESGVRTNLYLINVGFTSAGKDHALKSIVKILHAGDADDLWIGEVTSDSAVEHALQLNPRRMLLIDEAGHFFSACNDLSGGSALRSVKPLLLRAWSSANGMFKGKQRAPQNGKNAIPVEIYCPHVMLLGTTQPQIYFHSITRADVNDGWLARTIFFISRTRPELDLNVQPRPVPQAVVDEVARFRDDTNEKAKLVLTDPRAQDVLMAFNREVCQKMRLGDLGNSEISYLYGKAVENARRIALIIAISRNSFAAQPLIREEDMRYGVDLVSYTIKFAIDAIEDNLAENEDERNKKRLLKIIKEAGPVGISRQDLTRKSQFINGPQRREYIDDLCEAHAIVFHDTATGSRIFKLAS